MWIGPHADAIDAMGDKLRARRAMEKAACPSCPAAPRPSTASTQAKAAAERYGLPLALKAAAGGGGKGLKVARTIEELRAAFETARREALAYFKDDVIYAERYLEDPKHVELQFARRPPRQRGTSRRARLFVATPSPKTLGRDSRHRPERVRVAMREAGVRAARAIGYDSVGTIECLVAGDEFFFLK